MAKGAIEDPGCNKLRDERDCGQESRVEDPGSSRRSSNHLNRGRFIRKYFCPRPPRPTVEVEEHMHAKRLHLRSSLLGSHERNVDKVLYCAHNLSAVRGPVVWRCSKTNDLEPGSVMQPIDRLGEMRQRVIAKV